MKADPRLIPKMMRAVLILLLAVGIASPQTTARSVRLTAVAIVGGTLIDGTGRAPIPDAVVVIEGQRIIAAGARAKVEIPQGARTISAAGKFILPGLIDNHVHYRDWQGELYIAHGVTTVKDLGNPVEWMMALSEAQRAGRLRGPRIYYVGNVIDMPPAAKDHYLVTESADRARAFVRKLRDSGAIGIKVHHQMKPELLRAITDEAHKMNLTVTGHLYVMGAREAVMAGIDGLDHSTGLSHSLSDAEEKPRESASDFEAYYTEMEDYYRLDPKKYDGLIEVMVQRGVVVLPTLTSWWRVATDQADTYAREDAEFARLPQLKYVPEDVREIWRSSDRYKAPTPAHMERFRVGYRKTQDFLRRFRSAGGRVLPGSSTVESVPGLSQIRELELMTALGYSPLEVIVATTRGNADFMGIAHELGTVEAGKLADIIIVNRDPLQDIRNLKAIETVIIGGVVQDLRYHPDHSIPIPRPKLTRPLWIERQIQEEQRRSAERTSKER